MPTWICSPCTNVSTRTCGLLIGAAESSRREVSAYDIRSFDGVLENDRYKLTFNDKGNITSIINKTNKTGTDGNPAGVELLAGESNVITAYVDKSGYFNCWEINHNYREYPLETSLCDIALIEDAGFRSTVKIVKKIEDSWINQFITIYKDNPRIDFRTTADMNDSELFMRVDFDTGIKASSASYDLSMGYIDRDAQGDSEESRSQFEVPMHKWQAVRRADGSGIALLNDCKYGGKIQDGVISQSLVKTAVFPDESQDIGLHVFTYSLLPFNSEEGLDHVTRQAYELNNTPVTLPLSLNKPCNSWIHSDLSGVIVQSIKLPENEDAHSVIIRMHEHEGIGKTITIDTATGGMFDGYSIEHAELCTPLEETVSTLGVTNDPDEAISIDFSPFEMKTLKLKLKPDPSCSRVD